MSGNQNWRTEVDAQDYFGHQKKQLNVADRRPVIRKASDLVGPGIGLSATRITDFNNLLATFDGYYSAEAGAANAPTDDQQYVGITTMDAELGGVQVFYGLTDNGVYRRIFTRNPADASAIYWGAWRGEVDTDDADWHIVGEAGEPAFGTGWSQYAGWTTPGFKRTNGWTSLKGMLACSSTFAAGAQTALPNSTLFILPEGYRPAETMHVPRVDHTNSVARYNIKNDGSIVLNYSVSATSANLWFSLDGISFPAEQ